MQTVTLKIQDSYMQQFMNFVKESHSNITVAKDKNLELDPYFYERKRELKQIIEDSEDGTMEMLSQEQYEKEMKIFFKDLNANANL